MGRQLLGLVLAALCSSSCGAHLPPTLSPEGRLAVQGRQVIAAADAVLSATETAVNAGALSPAHGVPIARAVGRVAEAGGRLADALRVVDATTGADRQIAAGQARAVLASMLSSLESIPPESRAGVAGQLQRVFDTIRDLTFALPPVVATP